MPTLKNHQVWVAPGNIEMPAVFVALIELRGKELRKNVSLRILRIHRDLLGQANDVEAVRRSLLERLGDKAENGDLSITREHENWAQFEKEYLELMNGDFEVESGSIRFSELPDDVKAETIAALGDLFEDDSEKGN